MRSIRILGHASVALVAGVTCGQPSSEPTCSIGSCASVPPVPDGPPTSSTDTVTFAVDTYWLGDMARGSSTTSSMAWRQFGFDLDGKVTDVGSTDVCARVDGSPTSVQADAIRSCPSDGGCLQAGVDNGFGANLVPIIGALMKTGAPSEAVTREIRSGHFTMQFRITGLSAGARTNTGLAMQSFPSGPFDSDAMPSFAPTEQWPVLTTALRDPNDFDSGAKDIFPTAYVTNGHFVSGFGAMTIGLPLAGLVLAPVRRAVVVMDVSADGLAVTNGTIAGVVGTEDLIAAVRVAAGRISKSLCGSALDGIAQQLRQTADILADGTNGAGRACDGISFAIGFEGKRVANPTRALAPVYDDPCIARDAGDAATEQ